MSKPQNDPNETRYEDVGRVSDTLDGGGASQGPRSHETPANRAKSDAESQLQKLPYPKSVFFIISNEFCERFNYYGMRTILVLYLIRQLGYSNDLATVIFHIFTMFVYFLCVLGAIISDSWLGKFKTILYLSMVYVCGSILVTVGAVPPLNLPANEFTMVGLALIALGSGGIKPCVSAFGGDQFQLPQQVKQMTTYFSLFYFAINAGSLISTTVTPILREDIQCFGAKECYSLAFGVPAILMAVSIVIFVLGRPMYKCKPPAGNMVVMVSKTIGNAIATKWRESKTNPREHWLDYADKKYSPKLIADVKVLMRILVLYLPLPIFWALFDQQGSRWTLQATRMDGNMGSWDIKPDQLQVLNPLLILAFIPLYDVAFYPALRLVGIRRPLQKLTLGGILAGIAFIISGVVELELEKTYPNLPKGHLSQLRIFNGENCMYNVSSNLEQMKSFQLNTLNYSYTDINVPDEKLHLELSFLAIGEKSPQANKCPAFEKQTLSLEGGKAYTLLLNSWNRSNPVVWYEDYVDKPSRGSPLVRSLVNIADMNSTISWKSMKHQTIDHSEGVSLRNLTELTAGEYEILLNDVLTGIKVQLEVGGVYTLLLSQESKSPASFKSHLFTITQPNSMNILWLIPQYVVMTLGEVMFSVTGLEFSYSQAPETMKSVLQACWLLTVAIGNVIVVIIAELSLFESQASEFFLFAGLMLIDMCLFMFMAYLYKPNNQTHSGAKQADSDPQSSDTRITRDSSGE